MTSLTPQSRNQTTSQEAMTEGLVAGGLVLVPAVGSLYLAMQNAAFRLRTNWQSRTAMVIMPALFAFALTSEQYVHDRMQQIAHESQHHAETVQWAEEQQQHQQAQVNASTTTDPATTKEMQLHSLYQESIAKSGVHIVPGDTLSLHHRVANYISANPVRTVALLAVPCVGLILYGRSGKEHLQLSIKLLHTRVFGQFTTICVLLSVMGFKDYMDRHGKFITQQEANQRVEEMKLIRLELTRRLEHEQEARQAQARQLVVEVEQQQDDNEPTADTRRTTKRRTKGKPNQRSTKTTDTEPTTTSSSTTATTTVSPVEIPTNESTPAVTASS